MLLVLLLVYLALELGIDVLLGVFTAGIVVRLFVERRRQPVIAGKLEAIGFGFLVPVFFVVSGMHFDLHAWCPPSALRRSCSWRSCWWSGACRPCSCTAGTSTRPAGAPGPLLGDRAPYDRGDHVHRLGGGPDPARNAAALVAAGVLSVLIFPMLGLGRLQAVQGAEAQAVTDGGGAHDGGAGGGGADELPEPPGRRGAATAGPRRRRHRAD